MFLHPGEYCKMQGAGRKKEQIEITVYSPDGTIIRPISAANFSDSYSGSTLGC